MQIDTHIIDTTETENNVKNDVKNLDLSLIQGTLESLIDAQSQISTQV